MNDLESYLRASSNRDDTSEEISDHCFQGNSQAIYMDGVDQTQTVLFIQKGEMQISRGQQVYQSSCTTVIIPYLL